MMIGQTTIPETFADGPPPVIGPRGKKRIVLSVVTAHAALVVIPLLILYVSQWLKPEKPKFIRVKLVTTPPPSPSTNATPNPAPAPDPTPTPKPAPKPKPAQKPKPKPKAKTKPKPTPKPKPKPKKTWKAAKPEDIKIASNVVTKRPPTPVVKHPVKLSSKDLLSRFRKNMRFEDAPTTNSGLTSQAVEDYYDTIAAFLYRRWKQPSQSQLHGRSPSTSIRITINDAGTVQNARISRHSGVRVMDDSVQTLLDGLSRLPKPPSGLRTLNVSLEVER